MRLPEHMNIAQLQNMITLKSFDLKIVKISTKQTLLENIDFKDTSRSEAYARSEPIYTLLDLNRFTPMGDQLPKVYLAVHGDHL